MSESDFARNRLLNASSPYLRQHALNPVHWQPWEAATLAHARATDTPILLSIGYSACHWCHVMAHESFEDPATAAAMNAGFVNIKLDREERPDIDQTYQLAYQALNGRGGGWPLTVFLDPQNLTPFYVGTYFPPTTRHGLPGFPDVLQRVRAYFDAHRDELRVQAGQLREWMQHAQPGAAGAPPGADTASATAMQRLAARFDARNGGNTGAPKFPRPAELEWLLDQRGDGNAGAMARLTLDAMAARGLQDQLGGGFFRYCVDADWTIPHFEKMLYDNAQLLPVYARTAAADGGGEFRTRASAAARGIALWLARDMSAPHGLFYSSLDADSEGAEGAFYLWTREQLRAAVPAADAVLAEQAFGLDAPPNFEGRAWHLLRTRPLGGIATRAGTSNQEIETDYLRVRAHLLAARTRRPAPSRDDKILTAWNALAIAGLARTARLLQDERCANMARTALTALKPAAWIDGRLFANVAAPAARIPGFLDDHAFLLDALLASMQLTFAADDLAWAIALADALLDQFSDPATGGFWFSTAAHATPLARHRDWTDDALPNGNGVAIRSLLRLGRFIGNTRYIDAAERALAAGAGALAQYPDACPTLLRALAEFEQPRMQIVVRCAQDKQDAWHAALRALPHARGTGRAGVPPDVFVIPAAAAALPGILATRTANAETGTAYVCSGMTCQAPLTSPAALAAALQAEPRN
ncbi:MAG: thioredoxin domain-containing protein [Rhodanobacteraceae bacterium]|nr:MAG: thioredoxin domain-containing protein [Rhodanobacteraceae bacterium]